MKTAFLVMIVAAAACLPLGAEAFPGGDVTAYIDSVDAVTLPRDCKARMAVVDTYSTGTEKDSEGFFIRKDNKVVWVATAPASQKNFALLRNEDVFYERFATTNKVVKTSATANSRGGETSNLDLTRFNTNLDYAASYVGTEDVAGKPCYVFELRAKNRKLAYSIVRLWVETSTRIPLKKAFYAVSEKVLKYYTVTDVTMKDGRVAEMQMEYVDALKTDERSRLRLYDITPVSSVPDQFFTREYLESGRLFPFDF
ncbi:MAG TPA: outer membrane lipoprotein-sorting protein [Spirochaetia bacterium]|nr:outer membrane lipoprotein-sorting protein [Spirochaetia bacterium]